MSPGLHADPCRPPRSTPQAPTCPHANGACFPPDVAVAEASTAASAAACLAKCTAAACTAATYSTFSELCLLHSTAAGAGAPADGDVYSRVPDSTYCFVPLPTFRVAQKDFAHGTLFISEPGLHVLQEDVEFLPYRARQLDVPVSTARATVRPHAAHVLWTAVLLGPGAASGCGRVSSSDLPLLRGLLRVAGQRVPLPIGARPRRRRRGCRGGAVRGARVQPRLLCRGRHPGERRHAARVGFIGLLG